MAAWIIKIYEIKKVAMFYFLVLILEILLLYDEMKEFENDSH